MAQRPLISGVGVGISVGVGVEISVGVGVGTFVDFGVGTFVDFGVGLFVGFGVGTFVGFGVGTFVGFGVGTFVGVGVETSAEVSAGAVLAEFVGTLVITGVAVANVTGTVGLVSTPSLQEAKIHKNNNTNAKEIIFFITYLLNFNRLYNYSIMIIRESHGTKRNIFFEKNGTPSAGEPTFGVHFLSSY